MSDATFKTARNNPPHLFVANTAYMLTAATYQKEPVMKSFHRKVEWHHAFCTAAEIYGWQIVAWVVLHDHYHVIVQSPGHAGNLSKFINSYHKFTGRKWNAEDKLKGRQVWWNYWDSCIRSERQFYNRLRYVFWNPVKHGLVEKPEDYGFSNYGQYLNQLQDFDFAALDEVNDVPEF